MSDIFISYAREDGRQAELLAHAFEALGWSVFWDRRIPAGQTWWTHVGKALESARCVVVAWSRSSICSHWVHEEADDGRQRGVLVPVLFEHIKPPIGFRSVQAADLVAWDGSLTADSFQRLVPAVASLVGGSDQVSPVGLPAGPRVPSRADTDLNRPVWIEGGTFQMGSTAHRLELPIHRVTLSGFWIQEHPVTNEEYCRFEPSHRFPTGAEKNPVVNITWPGAMAYAGFVGGSLPTEAQWEFAARGTEGRTYPWGEHEPACWLAHYWGCDPEATLSVMARPDGATPEGVHDLAGNVWEWVFDWYDGYNEADSTDPPGPDAGHWGRVLRGGSFANPARYLRASHRNNHDPLLKSDSFGFRVAWHHKMAAESQGVSEGDLAPIAHFVAARAVVLREVSWLSAVVHAEKMSLGGKLDWRLPSLEELHLIRHASLFPADLCYWSGKETTGGESFYMHFDDGHLGRGPRTFSKGLCAVFVSDRR